MRTIDTVEEEYPHSRATSASVTLPVLSVLRVKYLSVIETISEIIAQAADDFRGDD